MSESNAPPSGGHTIAMVVLFFLFFAFVRGCR